MTGGGQQRHAAVRVYCRRVATRQQPVPRRRLRTALVALTALVLAGTSAAADGAGPDPRPRAHILSASWGTDDAVGCPTGETGLDNIPVTFNWFIDPTSIQPADFRIVRSDGTTTTPVCALQFPPDEPDEAQTVNLIGDFGDSVDGPTPETVRVVGALQGHGPQTTRSRPVKHPRADVEPLSGGPYIVDAWTIRPAVYAGDANRCTVGRTFVRVMWSNGLTAYPTGDEVGEPVVASYRAVYRRTDGRVVRLAPLAVADLYDQETTFNSDNMHDLCLPRRPRGAQLERITIAAGLIQDPNGDPNLAQRFVRVR